MDVHLQEQDKKNERLKNIEQEIECPRCYLTYRCTSTPEMREKFVNQVIESAKITRGRPTYLDPTPTRPNQKSTLYVHRLRTAASWMVAGKLGLSFAPEFIRTPIVATYVAQREAELIGILEIFIQKTVDSITRKGLENTSRMKTADLMPIPNALYCITNLLISDYSTFCQ